MRNAHVTKRIAPCGYVAVTKPLARLLYNRGYNVTICGSNVNCYHVFNGWYLGYTIVREEADHFNSLVNSYVQYSDSELLRYPVFYVKKEVINNYDLDTKGE